MLWRDKDHGGNNDNYEDNITIRTFTVFIFTKKKNISSVAIALNFAFVDGSPNLQNGPWKTAPYTVPEDVHLLIWS